MVSTSIGTDNVHAGRGNIHIGAGVGKPCLQVVAVRGRHCDHTLIRSRIYDRIAPLIVVADRGEEDNTLAGGVINSGMYRVRCERTAETHIDDVGLLSHRPADGTNEVTGRADTALVQYLQRHNVRVPGQASNADAII